MATFHCYVRLPECNRNCLQGSWSHLYMWERWPFLVGPVYFDWIWHKWITVIDLSLIHGTFFLCFFNSKTCLFLLALERMPLGKHHLFLHVYTSWMQLLDTGGRPSTKWTPVAVFSCHRYGCLTGLWLTQYHSDTGWAPQPQLGLVKSCRYIQPFVFDRSAVDGLSAIACWLSGQCTNSETYL